MEEAAVKVKMNNKFTVYFSHCLYLRMYDTFSREALQVDTTARWARDTEIFLH
jgi:hypothetical protein